jgi:hypothetical protein
MTTNRAPHTPAPVGFFGIASGAALLTFIGLGFLLARVLPPPGPYSAGVTAAYYHSDVDLKRLGVILIIVGGTMFLPFGAAVADRLRHAPGIGPVAAMTEFGAAIISAALMMVFGSMLLVAFLRPDMPDSSYQLLNHMTWLAWVGLWQPGALQAASTAWAVLGDTSATPVFPRWVGWYSLCMAFGSLTGSLIPFFTSGPFTWNGFISFWIAGAIFFAWYIILLVQIAKTYRHARAQQSGLRTQSEHLYSDVPDTVAGVVEAAR